ncbi:lactaldehyde reductase [Paenibacillus macerans]|uniref:lactaldehyde reductase n=1 Tax=Paenibacillus macerans TaxID=44252 RepID=UPI00203D60D2|nr:lactaldehyde reductase [Paenibacillus macerans]MCM3701139.1 lactaldehyde reductase [Paenibacillus macerans]
MSQRMILNETSYFGTGAITDIVNEVKQRRFVKALIVTDKELVKHHVVSKVTDLLELHQLPYSVFNETVANPTIEVVQKGLAAFKSAGADYIIAIGGGSPMDTAKAIGIISNNPEYADVRSLEGAVSTAHKSVPIIAVPTTAGTAAEVTINYVITDTQNKRKFVCVDPHDIPIVAIVDPDMMSSMPKGLTAATGMDALTHAIEGYITKAAWELTDALHLKAVEIIARSLRGAVNNDPQGREGMALGQYIAGMGFSNVGLGLVHGMAHPLGAFYDTPHGVANAILLPSIMAYNADYTGEKYRDIAKAMGVPGTEQMGIQEVRSAAVAAVRQLSEDVGIPSRLREVGVREEDIPALARSAYEDVCTGGNPRETTVAEIEELYRAIY